MHTEVVFILDKSGSMAGLEKDTIGGYNSILKKQRNGEGTMNITTVLFDHEIELLHDRIPIKAVDLLSDEDYVIGGMTALYDAIGYAINKIDKVQKSLKATMQADKVLFVITTDGMENSSKKFIASNIKVLIEDRKKLGWEFLFLGANIDVAEVAQTIGICPEQAVEYIADEVGTLQNFAAINEAVSSTRNGNGLNASWKEKIEKDVSNRKKQ